jgi:hypothetical protein
VFGIDGTLAHEYAPVPLVCDFARSLSCPIVIVTARCEEERCKTSAMLSKCGLGDARLLMFPAHKRRTVEAVVEHKTTLLRQLKADLYIGDSWHDLGPDLCALAMTHDSKRFIVSDTWLKLPQLSPDHGATDHLAVHVAHKLA